MHADGLGDVLQDHRSHVLIAMLEECHLPLNDGARDLDQRLVANLQALQQPARLLELRAHRGMARVAADQAGIAAIESHARQSRGVDLDGPTVVGASHKDVRYDVLGGTGADGRAGPGMAGSDQCQSACDLIVRGSQLATQQ